jgi:hypothetical protein
MTIQYSTIQNPAKRYSYINDIELHDLRVDTIHHSAIYQIEVHKHILYIYIYAVFLNMYQMLWQRAKNITKL